MSTVTEYASDPTHCDRCPAGPLRREELEVLGVSSRDSLPRAPAAPENVSPEPATEPVAQAEEAPDRSASASADVRLENVAVVAGAVAGAATVVESLRRPVAECYRDALAHNPLAKGTVTLGLILHPSGAVGGAGVKSTGTLPASALNCVKARARAAKFSAPEGKSPVVQFDVVLEPAAAPGVEPPAASAVAESPEAAPPRLEPGSVPAASAQLATPPAAAAKGATPVAPLILTRLRVRYSAEGSGPDLELRAAPPIRALGGKSQPLSSDVVLDPEGLSQFRAEYFVRHRWSEPVSCANPVRSVWGPPPGGRPAPTVTVAQRPLPSTGPADLARFARHVGEASDETLATAAAMDSVLSAPVEPHRAPGRAMDPMSPEAREMRKIWLVAMGFLLVVLLGWHTRQIG